MPEQGNLKKAHTQNCWVIWKLKATQSHLSPVESPHSVILCQSVSKTSKNSFHQSLAPPSVPCLMLRQKSPSLPPRYSWPAKIQFGHQRDLIHLTALCVHHCDVFPFLYSHFLMLIPFCIYPFSTFQQTVGTLRPRVNLSCPIVHCSIYVLSTLMNGWFTKKWELTITDHVYHHLL